MYGSEQDVKDAEGIYARQLPNLDLRYLEKICDEMGVGQELALVRKRIADHGADGRTEQVSGSR